MKTPRHPGPVWQLMPLVLLLTLIAPAAAQGAKATPGDEAPRRQLAIVNTPWTGDFDAMKARRMIRVLVPHSRSLYFNDRGHERGLSAELVRDFERHLNKRLKTGAQPITVYIVPATRDRLLPGLREGLGDIAVGYLTVTDKRLEKVDFVAPDTTHRVNEILLTGPASPPVDSLEDLAGKTIHVRPASSYHESLKALNARFVETGLPAMNLVGLPDALEDEDMLEMLNAGLLELIVVDDWKASLWTPVLSEIVVRDDIVLREGGLTGWAIRKDSPLLREALEIFYQEYVGKQHVHRIRLADFHKKVKRLHRATGDAEYQRFVDTLALFEKYGDKYDFEPLMLAAQGYQESRLRQDAVSPVGAIGIMQLMPATGEQMGVGDITLAENNVHAGAKYMDHLISHYFDGADFSENDRMLFAFAAYSGGPGTIRRMRRLAEKEGLDPNRWFNNVELITGKHFSAETTGYVRNIYKYFVAYKLLQEGRMARERARKTLIDVRPEADAP